MSISVILPDASSKELPKGSTALDLAMVISGGLARQVVACKINGEVQDLRNELQDGDKIKLLKANSAEGLDTLRHSCEHILATAVCELFPGAQVAMGPKSHENNFYYDFDIGRPFNPEDLELIEAKMKEMIKAKIPFTREIVSKEEAGKRFTALGQKYKAEILEWIPTDQVSIYQSGAFLDLCRGPHLQHSGQIKAFKLLSTSGAYWRADSSREMLQRINGIAFDDKKTLKKHLFIMEEAKKRDHRRIGKELDLFLVSDKFDNHPYGLEGDIEMLVTGSIHADALHSGELRADSILDDALLDGLKDIFAPRVLKMNGYNVTSTKDTTAAMIDIKIRLFSGAPTKEQNILIKALEKKVNARHKSSNIRILPEAHYTEEIGPGLPMWLPKGGRLRTILEDYWRKAHFDDGYEIVVSPHIAKSDLWKVSGHWDFYREGMFPPMAVDGQEYIAKPMNCPFHIMMYKSRSRSYRDLPFRWAELGTVYRYEMTGALHGLMRVRGFTQDDAHIFCRWDQLSFEIDKVIAFILRVLKTFGFTEFEINLSTKPEKSVGKAEDWEKAEDALRQSIKRHDLPYVVDHGGGAFYGPKIDVKLKDSIGRMWQCSTLQLDFNNPNRFDLTYTNNEGKQEQPVMLHRALLGSIERFIGILIEEYIGAFPMWLSPEQVRIIPISDAQMDYAKQLKKMLKRKGLRVQITTTNDKLGAKIRNAQLEKIPMMLIIGDKEVQDAGATIRARDGKDLGFFAESALLNKLLEEAKIPDESLES